MVIFAALLSSCTPFLLNTMGYDILEGDLDESWRRVSAMAYTTEDEGYFKSPKEFFKDGGGDCEDFAAALVYLLGRDASMIAIGTEEPYHAIVLYRGEQIEPQIYGRYFRPARPIVDSWSYDEVMRMATNYGTKGL